MHEQRLSIPTYPFAAYLTAEPNPTYGGEVLRLKRAEYEAAHPAPAPQTYRALVVENAYLKLTFLPELGGRLYQCVYKPTNQPLFYNNAVLKPSYWGPLAREENWWLAAGGLEWAFPVNEHGYEWGTPWDAAAQRRGGGVEVALRRRAGALQAEIIIALAEGESRFTVSPRLTNMGDRPLAVQFWANATLSPGGPTVGPDLRLIFPAAQVIVHSAGDPALPAEGTVVPWPVLHGQDMSRYAVWRNWLGVFAAEPLPAFVGVYDTRADVGAARVLSGHGGAKLFGFGSAFPDFHTFADDGSAYVELWAGANRTFWPADDIVLLPGESLGWTETWILAAGIGGLTTATREVVMRVERQGDSVRVAVFSPARRVVLLRLVASGADVLAERLVLGPDNPFVRELPWTDGPLDLRVYAEDGILLGEATVP